MRIFLAEDNEADVWLIEEALNGCFPHFDLDLYSTAEDAARAARNCGKSGAAVPDLMLLDFNLPRGQGSDILSAAAENPHLADVPRVIVTSSLRPDEKEKAQKLGAACFLTKPPNLEDFLRDVRATVIDLLKQAGKIPS